MVVAIFCYALSLYWFLLIARIILSWATLFGWMPPASLSPVIRVLYDLTEPVLSFFRRYIPPVGGFDLSPIVVFLIIGFIRRGLGC